MKEETLKKVAAWVPLLIAAGYFAFIIVCYVKVVSELKITAVAKVEDAGHGLGNEG